MSSHTYAIRPGTSTKGIDLECGHGLRYVPVTLGVHHVECRICRRVTVADIHRPLAARDGWLRLTTNPAHQEVTA